MNTQYKMIDTHVHIVKQLGYGLNQFGEQFALGHGRVRYADGSEALLLPNEKDAFPPDELISVLNNGNVEKAIMLQGSTLGFCNEYTYLAQQAYPGRLFGMGTFDPFSLQSDRIMRRCAEEFNFLGYKFEISCSYGFMGYHPTYKITQEEMLPIYRYCHEKDIRISFDMSTFGTASMQAVELRQVAQANPDVLFVVEHCFYPSPASAPLLKEAAMLLKPCENVYFTTAAVPHATRPEPYPFAAANELIEMMCEIVGHKRIMWGTDIPQVLIPFSYAQLQHHLIDAKLFSESELEDIFYNNAARFYGI